MNSKSSFLYAIRDEANTSKLGVAIGRAVGTLRALGMRRLERGMESISG
jgi:hypothetical protein